MKELHKLAVQKALFAMRCALTPALTFTISAFRLYCKFTEHFAITSLLKIVTRLGRRSVFPYLRECGKQRRTECNVNRA